MTYNPNKRESPAQHFLDERGFPAALFAY